MVRLALGVVLLASAIAAKADLDYPAFQQLTRSLLKVEALNPDGSVSIGTGVVVGKGMVITNCHVTYHAHAIELVKGAVRKTVQSQHSDLEHDLCLLHSPQAEDVPAAVIGSENPKPGQTVYAVGFIFGVAPRLNYGEIKSLYDYDGAQVIQSTTPFTSGASGGGLFDEGGRLVGIVTFKHRGETAYHFSMPVRWVVEAMNHFQGQPVAPLSGTAFWQRPRESQPFFLRTATLEAAQNWDAMAAVAQLWTKAESSNVSAWHALAKAYYRLHRNDMSISACKTALSLDVNDAEAWYRLGLAYAGKGNRSDTEYAHQILLGLDGRLAEELSKHSLECSGTATLVC